MRWLAAVVKVLSKEKAERLIREIVDLTGGLTQRA
jgi:hypothetical protein